MNGMALLSVNFLYVMVYHKLAVAPQIPTTPYTRLANPIPPYDALTRPLKLILLFLLVFAPKTVRSRNTLTFPGDILLSFNRRVSWLMAEKSFQKPFIGRMATAIGALPVSRAMDVARPGKGTIFLPEPISNPRLLKGIGTDFTSPEFGPGFSLYLPAINGESHKLDIAEIRGSEIIFLKSQPASKDAFLQLTGKRDVSDKAVLGFCGSKFKVAPHVDQTKMYETVFRSLRHAGCVGIFPEGGSHDR